VRIESDETAKADVGEIIDKFASIKAQKVFFQLTYLCYFKGTGLICLCFDGNVFFEHT